MLPMIDYNEVAMFAAVVAAGGFAQAAKRLGIPPNSLSRHVESMRNWGVPGTTERRKGNLRG